MEHAHSTQKGWDDALPSPAKTPAFTLCRTTDRVLQILLRDDPARVRADTVARELGMSSTTLRRRLRADHTCYQFLLDRARQYRCERRLRQHRWPGRGATKHDQASGIGLLEAARDIKQEREGPEVGGTANNIRIPGVHFSRNGVGRTTFKVPEAEFQIGEARRFQCGRNHVKPEVRNELRHCRVAFGISRQQGYPASGSQVCPGHAVADPT